MLEQLQQSHSKVLSALDRALCSEMSNLYRAELQRFNERVSAAAKAHGDHCGTCRQAANAFLNGTPLDEIASHTRTVTSLLNVAFERKHV